MKRLNVFAGTVGAVTLVLLAAGPTAAGTAETMQSECLAQLNLPASACACIGSSAEVDLTPKQQEFVIAMITSDEAASVRLRGELTIVELTQAASWMGNAPKRCVSQ